MTINEKEYNKSILEIGLFFIATAAAILGLVLIFFSREAAIVSLIVACVLFFISRMLVGRSVLYIKQQLQETQL